MRTTLELPDDLMRSVKIRAVHEHKKLKDIIAELLRKGIAASRPSKTKIRPIKLRGGPITTKEIDAAIAWGRDQEMLLVDTNVVVYRLIDGNHTEEAQQLRRRDPDWHNEAFLLVEFTNVLASSIATKRMTFRLAEDFLGKAVTLFDGKLRSMPPASVLAAAVRHGVSAYGARFLALAEAIRLPVVTEDKKLRTAAPDLTQSLAEALALY